jgi:hypothetical protein
MIVFPIVNQSCRRFIALQDEQMVRHRALFGTYKGVRRIGNLSHHSREKVPIRHQVGGRGERNPAAKGPQKMWEKSRHQVDDVD